MRLRLPSDSFSIDDGVGDKLIPRKDSDGYDGLVTGIVTGLKPCPEPRVTGMTGYSLALEKNEKKSRKGSGSKLLPPPNK